MKSVANIAVVAFLIQAIPAQADTLADKRQALFNLLATSAALQLKCSAWRVDNLRAGLAFVEAGVKPEELTAKYRNPYLKALAEWTEKVRPLSEVAACEIIRSSYGPNGDLSPNFMIKQ